MHKANRKERKSSDLKGEWVFISISLIRDIYFKSYFKKSYFIGGVSGKGRVRKKQGQNNPALCPFYIPHIQGVLNPEQYQIVLLETLME